VVICIEWSSEDFAYGRAGVTASPSFHASLKSRMG